MRGGSTVDPTLASGGADSSQSGNPDEQADGPDGGKVAKMKFHPGAFADFCMLVGRMFYDDGSVVLLDFLVREGRAYTESDIRERLKWKESFLHQKLYFLEKQLLVQREQCSKGIKARVYWRVSPHIVTAVDWHYAKVIAGVQQQVEMSMRLHEFECPNCRTHHSALDIASGVRDIDDDHPLCRSCGERLSVSNSEEAKSEVREKHDRAIRQLAQLRTTLDRVRPMEVAAFPAYSRSKKKSDKSPLSMGSQPDDASATAATSIDPTTLSSPTSSLVGSACASSVSRNSKLSVGGKRQSALAPKFAAVGLPGSSPPSLQIHKSVTPAPTAPVNRNIPWINGTDANFYIPKLAGPTYHSLGNQSVAAASARLFTSPPPWASPAHSQVKLSASFAPVAASPTAAGVSPFRGVGPYTGNQ